MVHLPWVPSTQSRTWSIAAFAAEAADGYQGIDGLGRCGQSICVLDARKAMLHVLDDNGEHLAATAAPALAAAA